MIWTRAIQFGFLKLRGRVFLTAVLYLAILLASTIALRPLVNGFHAAFDESPAAADFFTGGGLDLLAELGVNQPAFWAAGFSLLLPVLLLYLVLGLFLTAGLYGVAAGEGRPAWRALLPEAMRLFWPFLGLLLLNIVFWAVVSIFAGLGVAAFWHGFKDATDSGIHWHLFLVTLGLAALLLTLFRNSVGFSQARYAVVGGGEGLGRCFLRALSFTFRRFVPVNGLTLLFNVLRGTGAILCLFVLSPGFGTFSARLLTALLLQAVFLWAAFLRVAEAGAQVEYQRGFREPVAVREPGPDKAEPTPEAGPVPEPGPVPAAEPPVVVESPPAGGNADEVAANLAVDSGPGGT